jgi:hypothetical protein
MRSAVPIRSAERVYAESYLDYKSDIFIFIEDKNEVTRKIILELIQRAISSEIKIDKVHSLGGREKVLDAFENKNDDRTEIYIIDGDLHMQYENRAFEKGLVILDRYCIENYLLDKKALLELLYEEAKSCNFEELSTTFDYDKWYEEQTPLFKELFLEYAIEKKNSLGLQTVKYPVNKLRSRDAKNKLLCTLDLELVHQRIENLKSDILELISEITYSQDKSLIEQKTEQTETYKFVSAKDYILPLVFERLKKVANNTKADVDNLKYRLSKICEVDAFKANLVPHLI